MRNSFLFVVLLGVLTGITACDESEQEANQAVPEAAEAQESAVNTLDTAAVDTMALREHDITLGDANAQVTVIEYASFSCSHCARFHLNTFPELKAEYIDDGVVHFVFRPFPLNAPALRASQLVYCAPEDKRFAFIKVLFEQQDDWAFGDNYREKLERLAQFGGMTKETFDACMEDKELETAILKEKQYAAQSLEISSTPSFLVNGTYLKGYQPIDQFRETIGAIIGTNAAPSAAESE